MIAFFLMIDVIELINYSFFYKTWWQWQYQQGKQCIRLYMHKVSIHNSQSILLSVFNRERLSTQIISRDSQGSPKKRLLSNIWSKSMKGENPLI